MSADHRPIISKRLGKFQISSWSFKRLRPARHDFDAERPYDVVRVCVQYSRFNRGKGLFERQQIWCDPYELRDLAALLDSLAEEAAPVAQPAAAAECHTA